MVHYDCCVNFGSQTICTTPSARCPDKDFLSNTGFSQPQNTAYILAQGCLKLDYKGYYTLHTTPTKPLCEKSATPMQRLLNFKFFF